MRVLIVNDLYSPSSAGGVAKSTAEALAALGFDVHFLATVQGAEEAGEFEANGVKVSLVHVPPYPIRWKAYLSLNNRSAVKAFRIHAKRIGARIIHFHNLHIHFSYAALRSAAETGARVVFTVHDVMPFCYQKMFCFLDETLEPGKPVDYRARLFRCARCARLRFNPLRNTLIRSLVSRFPDRVVAVSSPMGDALQQNGIRVDSIIHNGIDCRSWQPDEEGGAEFRERFGLKGCKVVFYGGRLDYLKGGLHMVRAVAALKPGMADVKLLVPGEGGRFRGEMVSMAASHGIEDALVFPGWLEGDDLKKAYAACNVVVSPSLCFESFNLINLEGMAMGKPVISSFFGGPSEVVAHNETGFLVNPLDERLLSEKTGLLLSNENLARRMGSAGQKRAKEMFRIEKTAKKTAMLYEDVLKGVD